MNEFDFSSATPDDFKTAGAPASESVADSVSKPAENASFDNTAAETAAQKTPEPAAKVDADYKFKDDFIKGVVEFYEKTGDITPYLQAKSMDFTKMTDEEIMRRDLREQYSELSDKAFDKLFKQEVLDKYKLDADEWGEDEAELGRELLKVQASKSRDKYLEWQKNFQAPEPGSDNTQELLQQFEESVRNNEATRQLLSAKKFSIKSGEDEFQFEVPNADAMVDMTIDNDKFFRQFSQEEGQLDYNKWYKTVAYSQNPEVFEKALINFGKTLGRSEVTKEIKNPSTSLGDLPTESSGDFTSGLLNAFLSRGISK
jgi:hypothetical protein